MNRLVIVGNGFDLAFGYETTLEQFLTWLLKTEISKCSKASLYQSPFIVPKVSIPPGLRDLDDKVNINFSDLNDFYISRYFNWKSKFLEGVVKNGVNKGWFEIEGAYYQALQGLFYPAGGINEVGLIILNSEMTDIVRYLEVYLKQQNEKKVLNQKQKRFLKRLADLNEISDMKKEKLEQLIFVNFNYTDILQYSLDQIDFETQPLIVHVHGKLNGSAEEPILVGYGDDIDSNYLRIQNSKNTEAARFIKSFHYERNRSYSSLLDICDADEFTIYIIGHSCGTTDRTLLKSLVEHQNCKKIKIFHKGAYDDFFKRNVALSRYFENKQERRRKMLSFDLNDVIPKTST